MTLSPEIRAATSPAFLKRGCVNVIGLEDIRNEAGARWDRMSETIYARLEAILRQTLGPADFFLRLNDTAYIVTMPASDSDDARLCCLRVAHELHTSLLGPCTVSQLHLSRVSQMGDELVLDEIVMPELADLAHKAGLKDLLTANVSGLHGGKLAATVVPRPAAPQYLHSFLPVWDSRNEAVTTFRLVTRRAVPGYEGDSPARIKEDLALTVASIYFGAGALARHLEAGERFLLNIPVPHEVLSSQIGRMEITSTCRSLSGEFRPFLIFELSSVPPGVPQSRMGDLVAALRPFCRAVTAQVAFRDHSYSAYQGVGLHAIGVSLPRFGVNAGDIRVEIGRLSAGARRLGLMTFLLDVSTPDLLQTVRDEAITYISGDVVGAARARPGAMQRLSAAQLSAQRIAS